MKLPCPALCYFNHFNYFDYFNYFNYFNYDITNLNRVSLFRQLLEELVTSTHADTLPSLFYYIPYSRHKHTSTYSNTYSGTVNNTYSDIGPPSYDSDQHNINAADRGTPSWLACDRQQFHQWKTFGDYRF